MIDPKSEVPENNEMKQAEPAITSRLCSLLSRVIRSKGIAVELAPDEVAGLGVAFNEATWLGAEVDTERRIAALTLAILTLPLPTQERETIL